MHHLFFAAAILAVALTPGDSSAQLPRAEAEHYQWTAASCQAYVDAYPRLLMPCTPGQADPVYRDCQADVRLATPSDQTDDIITFPNRDPTDPNIIRARVWFTGTGDHVVNAWAQAATYGNGGLHLRIKELSLWWPARFPYGWTQDSITPTEACNGAFCRTPERQSPLISKPAFLAAVTWTRYLAGPPEIDLTDTTTPREAFTSVRCVNAGCVQIGPCEPSPATLWLLLLPAATLLLIRYRWTKLVAIAVLLLPLTGIAEAKPRFKILGPNENAHQNQHARMDAAWRKADGYQDLNSWQVIAKGQRTKDGDCDCTIAPPWSLVSATPMTTELSCNPRTCTWSVGEVRDLLPTTGQAEGGTAQGVELGCHRFANADMHTVLANPFTPASMGANYTPSITFNNNDPEDWLDRFYNLLQFNRAIWTIDQTHAHFALYDDGLPAPHVCDNFGGSPFVGGPVQRAILGWNYEYELNVFDPVGLNNPPEFPGGDCLQYQMAGFRYDGSIFLTGVTPGLFHEHAVTCLMHEEGFFLCEFTATGRDGVGSPSYMNGYLTFIIQGVQLIPAFTRVRVTLTMTSYDVLRVFENGEIQQTYCPEEWVLPGSIW